MLLSIVKDEFIFTCLDNEYDFNIIDSTIRMNHL